MYKGLTAYSSEPRQFMFYNANSDLSELQHHHFTPLFGTLQST